MQREMVEERQDIVRYRYTFSEEDIAGQTEKEYQRLRANLEIPGFRKGKAPLNLVKNAINRQELLTRLMTYFGEQIQKDIEKEMENILDYSFEEGFKQEEKSMVFPVIVYRKPEVTLPEYQTIEVKKPVPSEEMIAIWREETLKMMLKDHSALSPKDTEAVYGDKVVFYYQVMNAEEKQLYSSKEETLLLEAENKTPMVEQLVGKKAGDSFVFERSFDSKEAPGEKLNFSYHVQVKEVYQLIPPEPNDAFAHEVSEELETIEDLYQHLDKSNKAYFDAVAAKNSKEQIKTALLEKSKVDFSPETVQLYLERHTEEMKKSGRYNQSKDSFPSEEEYLEHLRSEIREMLTLSWSIDKVAKGQNITVTDEKVQQMIRSNPEAFENNPEKFLAKYKNDPEYRYQIKSNIVDEEVLDYLLTQVTIVDEEFTDEKRTSEAPESSAESQESTTREEE